jgi:hypothetical protein
MRTGQDAMGRTRVFPPAAVERRETILRKNGIVLFSRSIEQDIIE